VFFLVSLEPVHFPNSDLQPNSTLQCFSVLPHHPYLLQHSPVLQRPIPLPHLPSEDTLLPSLLCPSSSSSSNDSLSSSVGVSVISPSSSEDSTNS